MVKVARQSREDEANRIKRELAPAVSRRLSPTPEAPVVPVMTGTHFHALDEKGRVIIPAKLRPALTDRFWLMLDENDNVALYNYQTGLDVLEHFEQMMSEYPGNEDIAAAVERSTGSADLVKVEGNWRVPVSELLRFHAQLDKEIVTVGVLNHAVLWSRSRWDAAQARRLQSPDVRRVQAEMLRAAASGFKNKSQVRTGGYEQAETEAIVEKFAEKHAEKHQAAPRLPSEDGGGRVLRASAAGVDAEQHAVETVASAGDGKRSPRVFTLSQLGR